MLVGVVALTLLAEVEGGCWFHMERSCWHLVV